MIGSYLKIYEAQTAIQGIKDHRGGGNIVTTLLIYALERKVINEALAVKMSDTHPYKAIPVIARTREEILEAKGSKYIFVPYDYIINELRKDGAIVGLPCQISRVPDTFLRIGLFCGLNCSWRCLDYVFKKHGIAKEDITYMDYRVPYNKKLLIKLKDGKVKYIKLWPLSFYFSYEMCLKCRDYTNHNADISVGDRRYKGWSTVIIRTQRGNELFQRAIEDDYIIANTLTEKDFLAARRSPMIQKEVNGGFINTKFVRVRGKWIEFLPMCLLKLVGLAYAFYLRYLK